MEFKYITKNIILFFTLLVIALPLNAQTLVKSNTVKNQVTSYPTDVYQTYNFELRHLRREGIGYLQLAEDNLVFLQVVEDDVISMQRLLQENIRIRRFNANNHEIVQFVKNKDVLKSSIVEDHVVFFSRIVEDHVVFLTRIVEDHVVFLDMVKSKTVSSDSKDSLNIVTPSNSQQTNTDSLKITYFRAKQMHRDSLKRSNAIDHLSLGISVGLMNAPGFDLAYKFRSHWTARLGYSYFDLSWNNRTFNIASTNTVAPNTSLLYSAAAHFSNINGLLEYGLGQKGRFRLITGAAFFTQKKLTASIEMLGQLKFNDAEIDGKALGSGSIEVGYANTVSPYIGFGIGRVTPRRRINVSLDCGVYYMGDYRIKINIKPGLIVKENEYNAPILERNLNAHSYYKILPSGNLRVSYRLY
jgi:hypothetical protein